MVRELLVNGSILHKLKHAVSLGSGIGHRTGVGGSGAGRLRLLSPISGEPGVNIGDSYQKMLAVVSRKNAVTQQVDGQGLRAEGYSTSRF